MVYSLKWIKASCTAVYDRRGETVEPGTVAATELLHANKKKIKELSIIALQRPPLADFVKLNTDGSCLNSTG